ncbi:MAG: hypothetical protein ABH879_07070 [archaeon]
MKDFKEVVKEINQTLNDILIFESLMSMIIIFLVVYIVLSLLFPYPYLNIVVSMIPAFVYLVRSVVADVKENKIRDVEKKYPSLNEKLRTAADNLDDSGVIVGVLEDQLVKELKEVKSSSFVNTNKIIWKVAAAVSLCFLMIFTASLDMHIYNFRELIKDGVASFPVKIRENGDSISDGFSFSGANTPSVVTTEDEIIISGEDDDDIFGDQSVAQLSDKELTVKITPISFEVEVREEETSERNYDTVYFDERDMYEDSVASLTKEQNEIVKAYFKKLAEG